MSDFLSFFLAILRDWQEQTPANQVAIAVTVLVPVIGWIWSSTRVTSYKRERDGAKSEVARLEGERKALQTKVAEAEAAEALYNPQTMLDKAKREREQGNEELAINALKVGFDNIAPGLSDLSKELADHRLSLMAEQNSGSALTSAARFARLAVLLTPGDRNAQNLLEEIVFAQSDAGSAVEDLDLWNTSLPSDPQKAEELISAIRNHGYKIHGDGLYRLARRLFSRGVTAAKRAGIYDSVPGFLVRYDEAQVLLLLGDLSMALEKVQALLPIRERVQGAEHPDVLTTRLLEAQLLCYRGNTLGALEKVRALLPIRERVQGTEHPGVLLTQFLETKILLDSGDTSSALKKLQSLLPVHERVNGTEHPDVLIARQYEALLLSLSNDNSGALERVQDLLPIAERVQGPKHPDVLRIRWIKAKVEADLGNREAALVELKAILPMQEAKLLTMHPYVRETRELIDKLSKS